MVWALILFLVLFPVPASAEPLGVDGVSLEVSSEGDSLDSEPVYGSVSALAAAPRSVPYDSVSTNSTYVDFFASMLPKIPWGDDYVFWRSGQYAYTLVIGDLDYSGGVFTGDDLSFVVLTTSNGYSGHVSLGSSSGSLDLDCSDYVVYSNLGFYPLLDSQSFYIEAIIFCLVVGLCCSCFRYIWSFLLRMGVRTHGGSGQ